MKRLSVLLTGCAILLASAPAAAQEAGDDSENIVVTGRAEKPSNVEVSRQARAITRPGNLYEHPLPRFEGWLCPGVLGLKPEHATLVIDRVRYNAEQLDLRLTEDDGTCRPNLIIAFVKDGQAELEALHKARGYLFQDLRPNERNELLSQPGPARVWTTTLTRTRDGMPVPKAKDLTSPPVVSMWMAHSKIYSAIREDIEQVVVLFDLNEGIKGKTLVQLADYATMRGLARTRPVSGDGQPMDTILALFDQEAPPPPEMTQFDRAYLGAVYDGMPNIAGITKVLGVNRQLRKQEKAAEAED